nr:MAG TPA: hypothetical protein [Caudoviricetes sp.]
MTMAQEVTNFARFFAAFNKLPYNGSRDEFKRQIVLQYTWNRTDSLREMTRREYNECCDALEKLNGQKDEEAEQIWEAMSKSPIKCDYNAFEGEAKTVKLMMMCAAIASVKELVKGK